MSRQRRPSVPAITTAAEQLTREGFRVSELDGYGGVGSSHRGRGHYEGRALDLNIGEGNVEADDPAMRARFDDVARRYSAAGYTVIWNGYYWRNGQRTSQKADGHRDHIHLEAPANLAAGEITPGPNVPSGPPMGREQQRQLRVDLDRDEDYYPNYLNDFHNVTYNIKLFMVDPETMSRINPYGMSAVEVSEVMHNAQKVIIAQSGVTSAINIKEFEMESVPEGDKSTGIKFQMTLVEPLGTSFYDVTKNASNLLGIANFQDSPYFIEISFKGYTEDGLPVENVLANYEPTIPGGSGSGRAPKFANGGKWFYGVFITTVDTELTEAGCTHLVKMTIGTQAGTGGWDGRHIPEMMMIRGRTLGELLDNFKEQLNSAQQRRYGIPLVTYDFVIDENSAVQLPSPMRQWSLVDSEHRFSNPHILGMDEVDGVPQIQITSTSPITDILNGVFANIKEARDLATNGVRITDEAVEGPPQARRQITIHNKAAVQVGKYSRIWGQYHKKYTYHIGTRFRNSIITDVQHAQETRSPSVQREMVKELRDKGFFRKRFDYYYTGMNTEVIKLDVKFQLSWGAILANVVGWGVSSAQVTTFASVNEQQVIEQRKLDEHIRYIADTRQLAERGKQTGQEINQVQQQIASALAPDGDKSKLPEYKARSDELTRQQEEYFSQVRERARVIETFEQDLPPVKHTTDGEIYAEDLVEPVEEPFQHRLVQAAADTGDRTGTGTSEPYHRDRAVFGAIMEQIAGGQPTMMGLDMEIRGDPYWLGSANLQRPAQADEEPYLAALDRGEVVFLLKVAYPFNASDEGNANFRESTRGDGVREDSFTGFYKVTKITHRFSEGKFTQELHAFRLTMLSVAQTLGYGYADGELNADDIRAEYERANGMEPSAGSGTIGQTSSAPRAPAATTEQQNHTMKTLYDEFRRLGWSEDGARAMVAQIGREGDYNADSMFGEHRDANPRAGTNIGMVSWNGPRRTEFIRYMNDRGFIQNGTVVRSDESLRAQAQFVDYEMSKPQYRQSYNIVRQPGLTYNQIEPTLSNNYVGWDRQGNTLGQSGSQRALDKQSAYYARLRELTGR
jgi:hypothetical protein